jgi:hypothetical protein
MKKYILLLLVLIASTVVGVPVSQASEFASSPATYDTMTVLNKFELDGYAHAVITYNYSDDTAFAVVLDPDGYTDTVYLGGYAFLFADYYTHILWACNSGCDNVANWDNIGGI